MYFLKKLLPALLISAALSSCSMISLKNFLMFEQGNHQSIWTPLATSPDGKVRYYVNKSSKKRQGEFIVFTGKTVLSAGVSPKIEGIPHYKTAIDVWSLNCSARTYRILATKLYDKSGHIIFSRNFIPEQVEEQVIEANTAADKQHKMMCSPQ